jgi:putative Mn2+ efflux pump MntP
MASGLVILYFGLRDRDASEVAESGWLVFGLPLSLSLDNLVSGAGLGAGGYPVFLSAVIIGAICTTMSLWGLFLGHWWRGLFPRRATVLSGAWLVLASVYSLVR